MPNGDERNWSRVCSTIDGFRARYGQWPTGIRLPPVIFNNLVSRVLSPLGFALVSSVLTLISDDKLEGVIIAFGGADAEFRYGDEESSGPGRGPHAFEFFGDDIFREELDFGFDYLHFPKASNC